MAAIGAQGSPNNGGQQAPAQYTNYFHVDTAANDVFNGEYTQAMGPYLVPVANNNAMAPADVADLACNCISQGVPSAFLLHLPDGNLHIYLQLAKFNTRMGLPPTPWDDDLMFIQKGDLINNQSVIVQWNNQYFHQVQNQIRVPTNTSFAAVST